MVGEYLAWWMLLAPVYVGVIAILWRTAKGLGVESRDRTTVAFQGKPREAQEELVDLRQEELMWYERYQEAREEWNNAASDGERESLQLHEKLELARREYAYAWLKRTELEKQIRGGWWA